MKVTIRGFKKTNRYLVYAQQGCQRFQIGYNSPVPKKDCIWMARMFLIALKNHDKEVLKNAN